jgi:dUTPase
MAVPVSAKSSTPAKERSKILPMEDIVQVKKREQWALLPVREQGNVPGYGAYNLYSTMLHRGVPTRVPIGLTFEPKENSAILVVGSSPTEWNRNIEVRGELLGTGRDLEVMLVNHGDEDVEINPLTRISTIVPLKASGGAPNVVSDLDPTERGESGFGSTGL